MKKRTHFTIRPYTPAELAGYYRVCRKTLSKWLRPFQNDIGPRTGNFYSSLQVAIILEKLGLPSVEME